MPSSFFLIMSMFLLPPGPDLIHQSLQLDDIHLSWGRGRGGLCSLLCSGYAPGSWAGSQGASDSRKFQMTVSAAWGGEGSAHYRDMGQARTQGRLVKGWTWVLE